VSNRRWGPDFDFSTSFTLEAPRERVHDVLLDLEHYCAWWPQVRAVAKLDDDHALVVCRSALPYDLDLLLAAVSRDPHLLEVGIDGPIQGFARFRLREVSPATTAVEFEQHVRARSPLFVAASYVVRPLLVWNHQRMMRGLVEGVREAVQPSAASAAS
jgi:hypothetical protein